MPDFDIHCNAHNTSRVHPHTPCDPRAEPRPYHISVREGSPQVAAAKERRSSRDRDENYGGGGSTGDAEGLTRRRSMRAGRVRRDASQLPGQPLTLPSSRHLLMFLAVVSVFPVISEIRCGVFAFDLVWDVQGRCGFP
ncbi:hypothetical protein J6590_038044 [Homalodisca vitripennis]|nr:hypothetical protein J6590_038044 [Homalodisca vitripennis]